MKIYFKLIKYIQEILLVISIIIMIVLPRMLVFNKEIISNDIITKLYLISHIFLFFVMIIRPLADIFTKINFIRPLVILRKGAGVMSASIIVSFILAKLMVDPIGYFSSIITLKYWSMVNYAVLAHIADISAVVLIITSNNFSKKLFGGWWKTIQKLAYVYFYGSTLYLLLSYQDMYMLVVLIIVSVVTLIAFIKNRNKNILIQNIL